MKTSPRSVRPRFANQLVCRAAGVMVIVFFAILALPQSVWGDDNRHTKSTAKRQLADAKITRRGRRIARASGPNSASMERHPKRSTKQRRARRKKRAERRLLPTDDNRVDLRLNGALAFDLGSGNVFRSEGSIVIEIDRAMADKIRKGSLKHFEQAAPVAKEVLRTLLAVPETVETTAEILRSLSDPQTQESLRQVQQLLQLMPRTGDKPGS